MSSAAKSGSPPNPTSALQPGYISCALRGTSFVVLLAGANGPSTTDQSLATPHSSFRTKRSALRNLGSLLCVFGCRLSSVFVGAGTTGTVGSDPACANAWPAGTSSSTKASGPRLARPSAGTENTSSSPATWPFPTAVQRICTLPPSAPTCTSLRSSRQRTRNSTVRWGMEFPSPIVYLA